jgi:hypothetical protein
VKTFKVYENISLNSAQNEKCFKYNCKGGGGKHTFQLLFFPENHAVYEIMLKNVVEPESTKDNKIRRMQVACWKSKATRAHAHAHPQAPGHSHIHTRVYIYIHIVITIMPYDSEVFF